MQQTTLLHMKSSLAMLNRQADGRVIKGKGDGFV